MSGAETSVADPADVAAAPRRLRELIAADPARVGALGAKERWEVYNCLRSLGDLPTAATVLDALAAAFCVLGPGHLFPKRYEGPELLKVSASHALTALDVLGLLCTGGAAALGAPLAWWRVVAPGARRGRPPGGRT